MICLPEQPGICSNKQPCAYDCPRKGKVLRLRAPVVAPTKAALTESGRPADPLVPAALPVARRFLLLLPPLPLLSAVVENLSTDEFLLKLACKQIYSLFEGPSSETPVSAETICRYTDLGNTVFFYRTLKFSRERALFALI